MKWSCKKDFCSTNLSWHYLRCKVREKGKGYDEDMWKLSVKQFATPNIHSAKRSISPKKHANTATSAGKFREYLHLGDWLAEEMA